MEDFERLSLEIVMTPPNVAPLITAFSIQPTLRYRIKSQQKYDQSMEFIKVEIDAGKHKDFTIVDDKAVYHQGWLCTRLRGTKK